VRGSLASSWDGRWVGAGMLVWRPVLEIRFFLWLIEYALLPCRNEFEPFLTIDDCGEMRILFLKGDGARASGYR
jgi:hypothetical protein